jgi:hypothetical protein
MKTKMRTMLEDSDKSKATTNKAVFLFLEFETIECEDYNRFYKTHSRDEPIP